MALSRHVVFYEWKSFFTILRSFRVANHVLVQTVWLCYKDFMQNLTQAQALDPLRHTAAHVLAAAVLDLWPEAKLTLGPPVEDGFYYDIEFPTPIAETDLKKIEKQMKKILQKWTEFTHEEVSAEAARQVFANNKYKLELIDEIAERGDKITLYTCGGFTDLCRGGHVERPSKELKHFKLLSLAGAYWRGNEKNAMLTRIYGTAFPTKEELDEFLKMREEAKKRDHRVLGPKLDLFMFHETAPGMPYWLPKGMIMLNELIRFWREEHAARGYHEISSPIINKKELWETSGHWEHYREDMFIADMGEGEVYGVKAMNCPNAMVVFGSRPRSYRELPLRLSDTDILHRYERSGTLNGLLRVRSFRQDDSHNFVTEDQIQQEYRNILEIVERFYSIFGLEYRLRLSTRPEKFMGDMATWDRAESELKELLIEKIGEGKYEIGEGEGAFYGPKVDILMKDSLKREWQMGTIQLDFQQPRRFGLEYVDKDGSRKTPVVIHRVIYGSLERFIGILVEHTGGALPVWLAPIQAVVLPITDEQNDYAKSVAEELKKSGIRVDVDARSESVGKKIREAEMQKIPYMIVVGKKEVEDKTISVRERGSQQQTVQALSDFTKVFAKPL